MPRRLLAMAAALAVATLLLVPAAATHEAASCKALAFGLVTPLTPFGCEAEVACPPGHGACTFDLYLDTEAGGLVGVEALVDGAPVATCGPVLGLCGTVARFTVPEGQTAELRCHTVALSASLMAELDCNTSPVA